MKRDLLYLARKKERRDGEGIEGAKDIDGCAEPPISIPGN